MQDITYKICYVAFVSAWNIFVFLSQRHCKVEERGWLCACVVRLDFTVRYSPDENYTGPDHRILLKNYIESLRATFLLVFVKTVSEVRPLSRRREISLFRREIPGWCVLQYCACLVPGVYLVASVVRPVTVFLKVLE